MFTLDKRNILESLTTAVLITDKTFIIEYANTAAEQLCGISRSRLVNHCATNLIDRSEETLLKTLQETDFYKDFQVFSAAGVLLSPLAGKSTKADITIFHYNHENFDGLLIEIHTISQQEKLINQIQQNYQYTAARDLIRSLAHEIKNPLGGIRGAAQLIEMMYGNTIKDIKEYTNVIIEQSDRLKVLVNNLLGPQKPNPLTKVNIHYLLEKVIKLVQMQPEIKNIKLIKDYDPSLPELDLDQDSVEQVILNIVNNAIQALGEVDKEDKYIRIKSRASIRTIVRNKKYPTAIIISISNNGPEIPENILRTIFFPMVTTKTNGNGLGLCIALNIIERHHGTIECASDANETTFKIILPLKSSRKNGEQ